MSSPFLIADPRVGLVLNRQPWRTPADALSNSINAEIYRGRIQKRPGTTLFGRIVRREEDESVATGDGGDTYNWIEPANPFLYPITSAGLVVTSDPGGPNEQTQTFTFTTVELEDDPSGSLFVTKTSGGFTLRLYPDAGWIRDIVFPNPVGIGEDIQISYDYLAVVEQTVVGEENGEIQPFTGFGEQSGHTLANKRVKPVNVTFMSGGDTIDNSGPEPLFWSGDGAPFNVSDVRYREAMFALRWTVSPPPVGTPVTVDYTYFEPEPVMGLFKLIQTGTENLLLLTRKRVHRWDGTAFVDLDPTSADQFTGGDTDFFIATQSREEATGDEILIVCNGVDPQIKINPSGVAGSRVLVAGTTGHPSVTTGHPVVDFDGNVISASEVQIARHVIEHQESVVYLDIDEATPGRLRRRVRWTQPAQYETLREFDFADAPTDDVPVGMIEWRDEIWVFFQRNIFLLRNTGNPAPGQLFEWIRRDAEAGTVAPRSLIKTRGAVFHLDKTGLHRFNALNASRVDEILGNYTDQIDPNRAFISVATRVRDRQQIWLAHADVGALDPDRVLVISREFGQFTQWRIENALCFTEFEQSNTPLVDEIFDIVDDVDTIVDSTALVAGFPITLIGRRDGAVLSFPAPVASDHRDADIVWRVEFAGLNPFLAQGQSQKARLTLLQLYLDAITGETLEISLFRDSSSTPYFTTELDISPDAAGTGTKIWRTIEVNETATLHDIRIDNTSKRAMAIDAIVPHFKPDGPIWSNA